MRIVVISDQDNTKRREHIINEFNRIHIDFDFFNAVMANKMDRKELESKALMNTFLSPGEIGCALSHCAVYEDFLTSDDKSLLICEDDICFTNDFNIDVVKQIADFIESSDEPRLVVLQKSIYHHKKIQDINETVSIYSARNIFGAYGYILNRTAANNIKDIQTPVKFEIDAFKFYYWLNACKLYCLNKDLITILGDEVVESTIQDRWVSNRKQLKDNAYKTVYKSLSIKNKIRSNLRRLQKALYKPFENLDY